MRWLIYALGGGMGHVVRASAIARAARRRGIECTVLVNSPFARRWRLASAMPWLTHLPRPTTRELVLARLHQELTRHDALIVDAFPRGLAGELPAVVHQCSKPTVLISRVAQSAYQAQHRVREAIADYDLVIEAGENSGVAAAVKVSPIVFCDAAELLPRAFARAQFGLHPADDRPLVVLPQVGNAREAHQQRLLARALHQHVGTAIAVRLADPLHVRAPLLRLLHGVDAVVGAGGYHTTWECRQAGVPLFARAQRRRLDVQAQRLHAHESWRSLPLLCENILRLQPRRTSTAQFRSGAHAAVAAISTLCGC